MNPRLKDSAAPGSFHGDSVLTPEHTALVQSCRDMAALEAEYRLVRSLLREILDRGLPTSVRERAEWALMSRSGDGKTRRKDS
jgi:hypothetical protein